MAPFAEVPVAIVQAKGAGGACVALIALRLRRRAPLVPTAEVRVILGCVVVEQKYKQ